MLYSGRLAGWLSVLALMALMAFAPPAQVPVIELSAQAGFDGRFRDGEWLPVMVQARNEGDSVSGRLVVRPETSGAGITNTFSTPVDLPTGAAQSITLYITAQSFASQVRVELIDDQGQVLASETVPIRAAQPKDRIYVVLSQSPAGAVSMTGATFGGSAAFQTNWRVEDLPTLASALTPVDVILFSDIDSSAMSSAQQRALADWVSDGGHLIVTGGAAWERTASGLVDLLPIEPSGSITTPDLNALARWLRVSPATSLTGETVLATGSLRPGAQVLVSAGDTPLLVRRKHGAGTVDYLAADPNTAPLRGWSGLTALWQTLQLTVAPQPGWTKGFTQWDLASDAVEILPGFNLLPDALPLCGFLGLYIILIGPVNYFVLSRLNRRELAWITIPLLIVVFSALSWLLGFNLRGTEATLSRLAVVRSWPESDRAIVDGLVGLLSPRRAQYNLTLAGGSALRPLPRVADGNVLTTNVQSSIDIRQTNVFTASDFAVDASFIAGFSTTGTVEKPAIGGSASLALDRATGLWRVRGLVRNESDQTLENPVVLARGVAHRLEAPLAPGDSAAFDFTLPEETAPPPLLATSAAGTPRYAFSFYNAMLQAQTVNDILGTEPLRPGARLTSEDEEQRRRRLFLASFVNDFYAYASTTAASTVSTGRADHVYLAGWNAGTSPLPVELEGAAWNSNDTTLYLIELEVEHVPPTGNVTITSDLFSWTAEEQTGLRDFAPFNLSLQPGDQVAFRFIPFPSAVLNEVRTLKIALERTSIGDHAIPIEVFNWLDGVWEEVTLIERIWQAEDPEPYLGPQNMVMVRVTSDLVGGFIRIDRLHVEQQGRF
ncbi:MAG: hypothetical protein DIU68_011320 [Chloroflexota bacterium]|nr:MAG: hypothetical protein DIU68_07235 [Chloroflexota bacterium]